MFCILLKSPHLLVLDLYRERILIYLVSGIGLE